MIIVYSDTQLSELDKIDLDGQIDEDRHIEYMGKAIKLPDGIWVCLAAVQGCLCRVEVSFRQQ
jgi:hypothetical protein